MRLLIKGDLIVNKFQKLRTENVIYTVSYNSIPKKNKVRTLLNRSLKLS